MYNKRNIASLILMILFMLSLMSCENDKSKQGVSQELTEITICQWGQALIYLPLYIAEQEGFFSDEGLDVKIINGGGDDLTWAAVTSGNAQFGIADPTFVAIQHEQGGVPGKVIGSIVDKVAFWAVTFDKNVKEIKAPSDFKGNTIACFKYPNTANALALETFQKGGLTLNEDVWMVPVNYGAVLAQLQNEEANIAMVLEPAASQAVNVGAKIVYSYPEEFGYFAFTGLTATQKYIDENPEVVQSVVNALQRSMIYARENKGGTIEVGKAAFPDLKEEVITMAVNRMLTESTLPENIAVKESGWQQALEISKSVGRLKQVYPTEKFVDNRFANKAIKNSEINSD